MRENPNCACGPKRVYDSAPFHLRETCTQVCLPQGAHGRVEADRRCVRVYVHAVYPAGRCGEVCLCGFVCVKLCLPGPDVWIQVPFETRMRVPKEAPYEVAAIIEEAVVCAVRGGMHGCCEVEIDLCGSFYILVTAPGCCHNKPCCPPLYPPDYCEKPPKPDLCAPPCGFDLGPPAQEFCRRPSRYGEFCR